MTTPGFKSVKPREGYAIRDPFTKQTIPPEGMEVYFDGTYRTVVQKHIDAGDLIDLDAPRQNALKELGTDQRSASSNREVKS